MKGGYLLLFISHNRRPRSPSSSLDTGEARFFHLPTCSRHKTTGLPEWSTSHRKRAALSSCPLFSTNSGKTLSSRAPLQLHNQHTSSSARFVFRYLLKRSHSTSHSAFALVGCAVFTSPIEMLISNQRAEALLTLSPVTVALVSMRDTKCPCGWHVFDEDGKIVSSKSCRYIWWREKSTTAAHSLYLMVGKFINLFYRSFVSKWKWKACKLHF